MSNKSSVPHLEDLSVCDILKNLRRLGDLVITEKMDGANIQFGLDENGFYTSRESKGGDRKYSETDYDARKFASTYQRSAHLALENVLDVMKENGLQVGDRIEAEVLFGNLPNAVAYNSEINRLVFLRSLDGGIDLDKIIQSLENKEVSVKIYNIRTADGRSTTAYDDTHSWAFCGVPELTISSQCQKLLNEQLDSLERYLSVESGVLALSAFQILTMPLNVKMTDLPNDASWSEIKNQIKVIRENHHNVLKSPEGPHNYIFRIKNILLDELIRKNSSKYGPPIHQGGWIEGAVFRNKMTGFQFKIVDKETFTTIKDFLWRERSKIITKPKSVDDHCSFVADFDFAIYSIFGVPELATIFAKRHIKKYGDVKSEIVKNIAKDISDTHDVIREILIRLLSTKWLELDDMLKDYQLRRKGLKLEIELGGSLREFTYCDDIHTRTLQCYSEMFSKIHNLRLKAKTSSSKEELLGSLISDLI